MPSPKSGNAGSAVTPADPKAAKEADNSEPGSVDEVEGRQLEHEKAKFKPYKKDPKKKSWIEIELVDEEDEPVPGEAYRIILPDGETAAEGTLDDKGFARVDGIDPGSCKITFPELDKDAWEKA